MAEYDEWLQEVAKLTPDQVEELRHCDHQGGYSWWERDCQGIHLDRVCNKCFYVKMTKYRRETFEGYTQADIDERIEEDY